MLYKEVYQVVIMLQNRMV